MLINKDNPNDIYSTEIEIRYCEIDQMGIVHHSNYWNWFEITRIKWLAQHGISYQELENKGYFLPLIEANIHYFKPLRFGDRILVDSEPKRPRLSLINFDYKIHNQHNDLVTSASTSHALVGAHHRPIRFPKFLSDILPKLAPN
ncbi:MAG: acyl-CoA thioesterase [SAR324 cluster bacterium]|nr:acyl-CoA thioesterase [SAR324 cluster bacterium]